jgi:hypothetical protein
MRKRIHHGGTEDTERRATDEVHSQIFFTAKARSRENKPILYLHFFGVTFLIMF